MTLRRMWRGNVRIACFWLKKIYSVCMTGNRSMTIEKLNDRHISFHCENCRLFFSQKLNDPHVCVCQLAVINLVKTKWPAYFLPPWKLPAIVLIKKYVSVCLQTKRLWVRVQLLLASSFINLNDWNITSKELLANTFVKTNPAKKYLLTRS